jgi:hypothetical protein
VFVPHFDVILAELGLTRSQFEAGPSVTVPKELFKLLFRGVLQQSDFDDAYYFSRNSDVKKALDSKKISSGRDHFIRTGYFEGRKGLKATVDEDWYSDTYKDIGEALEKKVISSAEEHYRALGEVEWRIPSRKVAAEVRSWLRCFR